MTSFLDKFQPESTVKAFGAALGIQAETTGQVLHLSAGNLFGGVEKMLVTLARKKDIFPSMESHFGACFDGKLLEELIGVGASFFKLPPVSFRKPFSILRARKNLKCILGERKFDWVVCHGSWIHAVFGPVIKRSRAKLAHMVHGILARKSIQDFLASLSLPDLAIANSQATIQSASRLFPGIPIKVCYPPCELAKNAESVQSRNKLRSDRNISPETKIILSAGRFECGKGFEVLLGALGRLVDVPGWVCWIAGEPQRESDKEHLAHLKTLAQSLGLEGRIEWLGHVRDMMPIFSAADVYCQTNTLPESFGLTFIEAQAAGCPVVTTRIGGAMESVQDQWPNSLLEKATPDLVFRDLQKRLVSSCQRLG